MRKIVFYIVCFISAGTIRAMEYDKENIAPNSIRPAERVFKNITQSHQLTTKRVALVVANSSTGFVEYSPKFNAINLLYVEPKYRGTGYGSDLLKYACVDCKKNGCAFVRLNPTPFEYIQHGVMKSVSDQSATKKLINFYKRHGFTQQAYGGLALTKQLR